MLKTMRLFALLSLPFFHASESLTVSKNSTRDGDQTNIVLQLNHSGQRIAWASHEKKNDFHSCYKSGWKLNNKEFTTFSDAAVFFETLSLMQQKKHGK